MLFIIGAILFICVVGGFIADKLINSNKYKEKE